MFQTGKKWWALRDLNPRPPACKAGALPTELSALAFRRENLWIYFLCQTFFKEHKFWSGREDSNLRLLVPKTSALTGLRYAPHRLTPKKTAIQSQEFSSRSQDIR